MKLSQLYSPHSPDSVEPQISSVAQKITENQYKYELVYLFLMDYLVGIKVKLVVSLVMTHMNDITAFPIVI